MLPYWFSAMTMKSVGKAALAMVEEVRRQFNTISGLMEGTARPDYVRCVEISTQARSSAPRCTLFQVFWNPQTLHGGHRAPQLRALRRDLHAGAPAVWCRARHGSTSLRQPCCVQHASHKFQYSADHDGVCTLQFHIDTWHGSCAHLP